MQLLTDYFDLQQKIFEYFGYVEDWCVIPLDDSREMFWYLTGEGPGELHYADSEQELTDETGNYYIDEIYTQLFLRKWVYRDDKFTMVCCDPRVDGNKFLRILDNNRERQPSGD